jgi:AraC family transcriptional regulator
MENPYENFAEFYRLGPHRRFQQEHRSVSGLPLRLVRVEQGSHMLEDAATADQVLGLTLSGTARVHWSWGDRWRTLRQRRAGHFGVSPAYCPGFFDVEGDHRLLLLAWPQVFCETLFEQGGLDPARARDLGPVHDHYCLDPLVRQLCLALWRAADPQHPGPVLYTEALASSLLFRLSMHESRKTRPTVYHLDPETMRKLDAWLEAHLHEPFKVAAMADSIGWETRRFSAALLATTGFTAHRFVVERRVRRAERLLKDTIFSIADIALQCGFAHQSHLTRSFMAMRAITPGKLRS